MSRVSPRSGAGNGRARQRAVAGRRAGVQPASDGVVIRAARRAGLDQVIAIDASVTGGEKRSYWLSVFRRYGDGEQPERHSRVSATSWPVAGVILVGRRDR